ncbi:MAG TPA: radical SAM protein, partial [Clostridia bacterium]|nr:radical SAM protein [Clostridia bacterium]
MPRTGHVYIHIPFCLKKCLYCDFNSYPASSFGESYLDIVDLYARALVKEAAMMHLWLGSKGPASSKIGTVYVGGGTPSAVPADLLMYAVKKCIATITGETEKTEETEVTGESGVAAEIEMTVEVNPATVDIDSLRLLREEGVNRLSIGVQSFDDDILAVLGRLHTSREAVRAIDMAREVGFP